MKNRAHLWIAIGAVGGGLVALMIPGLNVAFGIAIGTAIGIAVGLERPAD